METFVPPFYFYKRNSVSFNIFVTFSTKLAIPTTVVHTRPSKFLLYIRVRF